MFLTRIAFIPWPSKLLRPFSTKCTHCLASTEPSVEKGCGLVVDQEVPGRISSHEGDVEFGSGPGLIWPSTVLESSGRCLRIWCWGCDLSEVSGQLWASHCFCILYTYPYGAKVCLSGKGSLGFSIWSETIPPVSVRSQVYVDHGS